MGIKRTVKNYLDRRVRLQTGKLLAEEGYIPMEETKEQDVFIVGFPKSGHTWMQYILTSAVYGVDPKFLRDSVVQEFVPDMHVRQYYKRYHERVFIKSHNLPSPTYKNVIYLVRDGRDAMVSYHAMLQKVTKDQITLDDMVRYDKGLFPCSWREHIQQWLISNPYKINLLVIKYEDLLTRPLDELSRLMSFLHLEANEDYCKAIIDNTRIEILRDKAIKHGLVHKVLNNSNGHKFFRQGKYGVYKTEMDSDLIEVFEQRAGAQLNYLNY